MSKYWSQQLKGLNPYVAGEQPQDRSYIKLNTNENPYPASPKVIEKIREIEAGDLARYPDPESSRLKQIIADNYNLDISSIFVGNGSDEVLAHSFLTFFKQVYPITFPDISYGFYPVYCGYFNIEYNVIPLDKNFKIRLERYPKTNGGIIFANPNGPTGIKVEIDDIKKLLERNTRSVVIVDEAYIDFGGESSVSLIDAYKNLLVVQTTSKSRSLAGMRVGYAMGNKQLIEGLNIAKNSFNPYPIDRIAETAAIAAFEDKEYFAETCTKIAETRSWTIEKLSAMSFEILPSQSNFLLARHADTKASKIYERLKQEGILVRYFSIPRIDEYIRITIGTQQDMETFIETLQTILKESD